MFPSFISAFTTNCSYFPISQAPAKPNFPLCPNILYTYFVPLLFIAFKSPFKRE